ncbi:MAG: alpha/beta hydrolase [Oscillospiraceae bacterium]|nr:alpha/beta hydrolase [Oscillospiraceae bacterium]
MRAVTVIIMIIVIFALLLAAAGWWVFYFACVRSANSRVGLAALGMGRRKRSTDANTAQAQDYADVIRAGLDWFNAQEKERVYITCWDGTTLAADVLPAENERGVILLFHGYRAEPAHDFSAVYRFYHELGYTLVSVHQRAHGDSGGQYICLGVKERYDCRDWALWALDRFGADTDVFLGGISMGAATVLMAAGLALPQNVRGIIADCGYVSAYEEIASILGKIPPRPLLDIVQFFTRAAAGFGLNDASTESALAKAKIPVLLVHGAADSMVPPECSVRSCAACAGEKHLLIVPDAGHGMSYLRAPDRCRAELQQFLLSHGR